MSETIGFIGLGNLGAPIAANLLSSGHGVSVYNRTAAKVDPLVAKGAQRATRPADALTRGGVVFSLVWDDAALEGIVNSDGFLERLGDGIHVSMSTVLPETSKRLAALHARHGSTLIEAPVFGRPEAAAARQLWVPYAGPRPAKQRIRPLLDSLGAQGVFDFGEEIGAATTVKLVGNLLIVSAVESMSEAFKLAENAGLEVSQVVEMLTTTLFAAPIYKNYGKMIANKSATFTSGGIPLKDTGLFTTTARGNGTSTPLSDALLALLKRRH